MKIVEALPPNWADIQATFPYVRTTQKGILFAWGDFGDVAEQGSTSSQKGETLSDMTKKRIHQ
jgi:hypothetical protein